MVASRGAADKLSRLGSRLFHSMPFLDTTRTLVDQHNYPPHLTIKLYNHSMLRKWDTTAIILKEDQLPLS